MDLSDDDLLASFLAKPPAARPTPGVVFAQPPQQPQQPAAPPIEDVDDKLLGSFLGSAPAAAPAPQARDPVGPWRPYLDWSRQQRALAQPSAPAAPAEADDNDPVLREPATWEDTKAVAGNALREAGTLNTAAANGVAQGFGPRLGALSESDPIGRAMGFKYDPVAKLFGEDKPIPTYDEALQHQQAILDNVRKDYPVASTAAEAGGSMLAAALPVGAAANGARGLGLPGRVLAGTGTGAAMGGVQGASESNDLGDWRQTLEHAGEGARVGAAFGAALPAAGAAIGAGYRAATPYLSAPPAGLTRTAAGLLGNATGLDTASRLEALGPHGMIADTSPSALGLAQGIASKAGPGADTVVNALEQRSAGQSDRLLGSINDNLGPAYSPREVHGMMDARQAAASPIYEDALRNAPAVDISPVVQQFENARLYAKGTDAARLDRIRPLLDGPQRVNGIAQPEYDARALHRAKTEMDAVIEGVKNQTGSAAASATRDLVGVRAALNDALQRQVPGYAEANLAWGAAERGRQAYEAGRGALKAGDNVLWPQDLDHQFAARPLEQQALYRSGTRSNIEQLLGTNPNDLAALKRIVGGENDWNRSKVGTIFGDEARDSVVRDVANEQRFADTNTKVVQGAQSAQRLGNSAAIDAAEPQYFLPKGGTMTGLLTHGGEYLTRKAFGAMAQASGDATRQSLARVLISDGKPATLDLQAVTDALMGRQQTGQTINDALSHRAALAAALMGHREATQ